MMNMVLMAIEQAGTFDTDAVLAVLNDPTFTFDYWGYMKNAKLGGEETVGMRRVLPIAIPFSVIEKGEAKQLSITWLEAP